jgi:dephospho-CoA kinase
VAIPLLIELNLQHLFDRLVIVYLPRDEQIERLAARDGISEEAAAEMLKAQLPIDEKTGYADFVIDNRRSLKETRSQVEALWRQLQDLQAERARAAKA